MSTQLPRYLLPKSLLQIADYCGDEVMWTIWENYGGGHLHVPLSVTPEHRLSQLLGYAVACRFCEAFGGEQLTIAKAESARRAVRNELIRLAKQQGADNFSLARRHNLTERQILKICRDEVSMGLMNFDLFD
jgi:hypothetical protein